NIDGTAFFQVLARDLGLAPEEHDRVPFGLFLLFAGLVLPRIRRGDAQVGHGISARRIARLRIAAEVADQYHFVDRGHRAFLPSMKGCPALKCTKAGPMRRQESEAGLWAGNRNAIY